LKSSDQEIRSFSVPAAKGKAFYATWLPGMAIKQAATRCRILCWPEDEPQVAQRKLHYRHQCSYGALSMMASPARPVVDIFSAKTVSTPLIQG